MNYGMATGDKAARSPLQVIDFNRKAGDTFRVFYSSEVPATAAPCGGVTRSGIGGFVCAGDGATQQTGR